MLKTKITDGQGTGIDANVNEQNALLVSVCSDPPLIPNKRKIFRQYLTVDGTPTGSSVMKVDGSSTNVDFWVPSDANNDRYITAVSFIIADASAALNKFGAVTALTNGCVFEYSRGSGDIVTIHNALKSNFDFVRLCLANPSIGQQANAFIANNIVGASEGVLPTFFFTTILPPYGLKLSAGTMARLTLRVRDDCSGVDGFDAIAYGFERIP